MHKALRYLLYLSIGIADSIIAERRVVIWIFAGSSYTFLRLILQRLTIDFGCIGGMVIKDATDKKCVIHKKMYLYEIREREKRLS